MRVRAAMTTVLFAALALPAPAAAVQEEDNRIATSFDGTKIVYKLFLPDSASAGSPVPAVLMTHGWAGSRQTSAGGRVGRFLSEGYAVLTWDQRGFGQSGGEVQVDSPGFEDRDVSALIDVLAADERIRKEAVGDPLVGMNGGSYAGGVQFIAAAIDGRIDAIVPEIAWNNLLESLSPDDVIKTGWGALLYGAGMTSASGGVTSPAGPQLGAYNPALHRAFLEGTGTGQFSAETKAFFSFRGPDRLLGEIRAPTFIVQATTDTLFPPSQAIDNFTTLAERRVGKSQLKMAWYCGGHGTCAPFSPGPGGYAEDRIVAWLDRWVKGEETLDTGPRFEYLTQDGTWHGARDYPVAGTEPRTGTGSGRVVVNGEPTAGGVVGAPATSARTSLKVPVDVPGGTVIGQPVVRLTATGVGAAADEVLRAPLFFQIINEATGQVLGNQITPKLLVADGTPHSYEFPIEALSYAVKPGDRLALEVVSTSGNYEPYRGAAAFDLERVEVALPVLP